MRFVVVLSLLLGATGVAAQTAPAQMRQVIIDMDEEVIEGARLVPPMQVIGGKDETKHKSLIRIRKDFRREMLASGSRL